MISESPGTGETAQFLSKQEILWKGFLNMLNVAKFVTKGYLVSGSAENLKAVQYCTLTFHTYSVIHTAQYSSNLSLSLELTVCCFV